MRVGWFCRGDIDGFFGLFIDNLLQLLLIAVLCTSVCGLPNELVYGRILPGSALSVLIGNLFYAWQARELARRTKRTDVTALPFGINTPSLVAYIFLILAPIYAQTHDAKLAWQAGLFACLLSAVLEIAGAFVGDWLRRRTPRAALLSALAGIAITFISMGFVFQLFAMPAIALIPLFLILFSYASRIKLPFGVPAGLLAALVGVVLAWGLRWMGHPYFVPSPEPLHISLALPRPYWGDLFAFLMNGEGWKHFSVILPMGLFNVIGSLQNLESAEAAGDRYETKPSLLVNGFASLAAAILGSPFPTTIYIGHPGWKAMGARWGYSILNGVAIAAICLTGAIPLVLKIMPIEATLGILLWVGIIILAQSFQEVPKKHALAVALGLTPGLAAWALLLVETTLRTAGVTLFDAAPRFGPELYIHGVIALSQGFMLTSTLYAAVLVFVIERRFLTAAGWMLAAAALAFVGLIHAYDLTPAGVQNRFGWNAAPVFTAAYVAGAGILALLHRTQKTAKH